MDNLKIILLSFCLFLAGCSANRIEVDLSKKYLVPVPEKKLNVHLESFYLSKHPFLYAFPFYKNSPKWDNDWVIYSERENSKYLVDFSTDTEKVKSNLTDLSRELNVLLTVFSLGLIPCYTEIEMPLYAKVQHVEGYETDPKLIGKVLKTEWIGWAALFIPDIEPNEAMLEKQPELTSYVAYEVYHMEEQLNAYKEWLKNKREQEEKEKKERKDSLINKFKKRANGEN